MDHERIQLEIRDWSEKTFGSREVTGPEVALTHLKKEADEAIADPFDLTELADIQILLWDAMWRSGFKLRDLYLEVCAKHGVNLRRDWTKQPDGTFQHVEDPA